jgi:poly(3-hydroxybutyrate) depolymerase
MTFLDRLCRALLWAVIAVSWSCAEAAKPPPLPPLGVEAEATVSGLSSGGYMAAQFAVVYSKSVKGVGVIAGGPYDCSQGDVVAATTRCSCVVPFGCSKPTPSILALQSWNQASGQEAGGVIDPLSGLKKQRVWLFSGGNDTTVATENVEAVRLFYVDDAKANAPPSRVLMKQLPAAGHGMPVVDDPRAVKCSLSAPPYFNDCHEDAAGELLAWLYTGSTMNKAAPVSQGLRPFDQTAYTAGLGVTGLDDAGFVYVPQACTATGAGCRVHVVFHGCHQGRETLGDRYATETGYNRWAEGSGIVVLYPQVKANPVGNPNGCWDFWGYTQLVPDTSAFATKDAPQMRAVRAMVAALQRRP